ADLLADSAGRDARALLVVLFDERCKAAQQTGTVGRGNRAPRRKGRLRTRDGSVGLRDARRLGLCQRLLRCRIQNGAHAPAPFSSRYARASATSASKSFWSSPASGCQSTPTANRCSGSSSPSIVPSSAQATSRKPLPIRPT